MTKITKLVAELASGCTIMDGARDCYSLSEELHIPVDFIHNDRRYKVYLDAIEIKEKEVK